MNFTELRLQLWRQGYTPLPLQGKLPNCRLGWQNGHNLTEDYIRAWERDFGYASNTGILAQHSPGLDLDITNTDCVEEMEALVRDRYEEAVVLVRVGRSPKRLIPFRTEEPFKKIQLLLIGANGAGEKLEFLADGQQWAAYGIHPDTKQDYQWPLGSLVDNARADLPYMREQEALALLEDLAAIAEKHGYTRPGHKRAGASGGRDYIGFEDLVADIRTGAALHDSVTKIAGKMARAQTPRQTCIDIVRGVYDSARQPRYADRWDECERAINDIYDKEEAKVHAAAAAAAAAAAGPVIWDDIDWDGVDVPEQEWTVTDLIPANETCLFSGYGGGGKSTIGLHLASAHALGRDWLGTLPELGGTFFIDAEDHINTIHIRLAAITKHYGCSFKDLIDGGLRIMSLHGQVAIMATADRNGVVRPTSLYERILRAAGDLKPSQIIIAPSANVFAGNEIDRAQVTQFVGLLTKIAVASGGSVILIAHPSITGMTNQSGISGSTAWHNAVRARLYLETLKNGEGADEQPEHEVRVLRFLKNQYGPPAKEISLRWQHGMFLPEPKPTSYETAARHAKAEEVFITVLRRLIGNSRPLSHKPTAHNYAPKAIALEEEATTAKVGRADLEEAMRRLFKANRIKVVPYGKPSAGWERIEEGP